MGIKDKDVDYVSALARLSISDEEKAKVRENLSRILELVGKISAVDTSSAEPMSHAIPLKNVFRRDEVRPSIPREKLMDLAPESSDGYIVVPKVIE